MTNDNENKTGNENNLNSQKQRSHSTIPSWMQ